MSLHVKKGEVLGLLGPNGAGKSTLLSILATLTKPSSGEVVINGQRLKKLKSTFAVKLATSRKILHCGKN